MAFRAGSFAGLKVQRSGIASAPEVLEKVEQLSETIFMRPIPLRLPRSLGHALPEVVLVVGLVAMTLFIRYTALEEIEGGGDALQIWYFARELHHGLDVSKVAFDHHMARFGVVIPAYLVQLFFGASGTAYYIAPIAASVGVVVLTYFVAKDVGGPLAGVLSGVFISVLPPMERAGSQLLPGVFGSLYVMLAAFALMKYWRTRRAGRAWVALCSVALFLAYLSHEPCLFVIPGFLYGVWACKREKKHALLFLGVLAGLAAAESLAYFAFTSYSSKVAVVLAKHGPGVVSSMARASSADFWTLFARYDRAMQTSWKLLLFGFMGAGLALLAYGPARLRGIILAGFGFMAGVTFTISGTNPLSTWLSFQSRYFGSIMALAAMSCALVVAGAIRGLLYAGRARYLAGKLDFALSVALIAGTGLIYHQGMEGRLPVVPNWIITKQRARDFEAAFEKGLPFVGRDSPGRTALLLVWSVYLPDRLVVREGRLPRLHEVVTEVTPGYFGISRQPEWLKGGAAAAATLERNKSCVYRASIHDYRVLLLQPLSALPEACSGKVFEVSN